ncbi:MAG TPA: RNA polymerase sigma factor, partial [Opitutaceae bacterium]|nr:RNA polymerase sigma factor [Opitutaceae bacterium]
LPHAMPPLNTEETRWFVAEVQPHERSLRSYLSRTLPSFADVDDAVQDCYSRILHAKKKGQVRSIRPLLFAIARNAVHDFFHSRARSAAIPITETAPMAVLEDRPGVVESICRQQELALLSDAIHALPSRCREVILLRKIKGYSQREIATMLGISENTVEVLAAKGTRRCAAFLKARGLGRQE